MAFMSFVVVELPPAEDWGGQGAYEAVFGQVPRIVLASVAAFWAGEFANSFVMARMKIWTNGKYLWTRTIGSTVVGQGFDSLIFYPLAFYGAPGWLTHQILLRSEERRGGKEGVSQVSFGWAPDHKKKK